MKKIAIISGTSGLIGMQLLHQLIKGDQYDYIISVARRKLALKHEKLVQISGDLAGLKNWVIEDKLREEDIGGIYFPLVAAINERVVEIHSFCSLGTTIKAAGSKEKFYQVDHDLVISFANWVKKLGATKLIYVSSLGADPMSNVFYSKVKGETEEDLKVFSFDYLGIIQPSILLGTRSEFRFGEEVAKILMKPLVWFKLLKKYRPIRDYQVAKAMIHHANEPKQVKVQVVPSSEIQDF